MRHDLALILIVVLYLYVSVALKEPAQHTFVLHCGHMRGFVVYGIESMIIPYSPTNDSKALSSRRLSNGYTCTLCITSHIGQSEDGHNYIRLEARSANGPRWICYAGLLEAHPVVVGKPGETRIICIQVHYNNPEPER